MANPALTTGLDTLQFARRTTLMLLENFPADKLVYQPIPGGNHAAWIAGHIAYADDYFMHTLGVRERRLPESWHKSCGYQSKPVGDAGAYPPLTELIDQLGALREELIKWLGTFSPEEIAEPLPTDWKDFAPNYAAFIGAAACHESMHAGQLTVIRKSLGLAPKFG